MNLACSLPIHYTRGFPIHRQSLLILRRCRNVRSAARNYGSLDFSSMSWASGRIGRSLESSEMKEAQSVVQEGLQRHISTAFNVSLAQVYIRGLLNRRYRSFENFRLISEIKDRRSRCFHDPVLHWRGYPNGYGLICHRQASPLYLWLVSEVQGI